MPRNRKPPPAWAAHLPPSHRGPAARRAAVAMLTAGALVGVTAFSLSPLPAELGLTALGCNQGKAAHTLEAARETRSQTRALLADLALSDDTRAQTLARDIAGLGFTPATQPPGWRQKAVDVSDQLNTLDPADPHLRKVAARLARAGLGPTPADMLPTQPPPPEPGPISKLGQALGGAADGAVDAVTAAGDALKKATAPQPAADSPTSSRGPAAPNPRRQAEHPLPETCLSHAEATTAPAAAAPAAPAARPAPQKPAPAPAPAAPAAPAAPTSSAAEPTPTPEPSSTSSGDAAAQPDTGSSTGSDEPPTSDSDDSGDPISSSSATSTEPSTGSPDSISDGSSGIDSDSGSSNSSNSSTSSSSGGGGSAEDLEKARVAIQLVGELMQALGASPDSDAGELRTSILGAVDRDKLEKLGADPADLATLDQLGDLTNPGGGSPDSSGSSGPDPSEPDSSESTSSETTGSDSSGSDSSSSSTGSGSGSSREPSTESAGTDSTDSTDSTSTDVSVGVVGGVGDAWKAEAEKLAEQVHQAADADPLAERLAEKLDAAGIGSQNGTGSSSSSSASPDSGTVQPDGQGAGQGSSGSAEQPSTGGGDSAGGADSTGAGSGGSQQEGAGAAHQPQSGDPIQRPGATDNTGNDTTSTSTSAGAGAGAGAGGAHSGEQGQAGDTASTDGEQPRDLEKAQAATQDGAGESARAATWDRLAQCESGGDWTANTGNGFSGGLQFSPSTWRAFGGQGEAHQASREQQIAVAEKVQAEQGWKAWPACSKRLGLA